jgi:hypothetical protein
VVAPDFSMAHRCSTGIVSIGWNPVKVIPWFMVLNFNITSKRGLVILRFCVVLLT